MKTNKWLEQGLKEGFDALEILIHENKSFKLSLEQGKIDACVHSNVKSFIVRGIYQNQKTSFSLEKLDDEAFLDALKNMKENCQNITSKEPALIFEGPATYPEVKENKFDFSQIPLDHKIQLLKELEKTISESVYLQKIDDLIYKESFSKTTLLNSKKVSLSHQNSCAYLYASGVFQKDKDIESFGESNLEKTFDAFDPVKLGRQIVDTTEKKIGGVSILSQKYPVVFSNEMFAELLDGFSDIFSGNSAYRNLTKLKDKVNHLIATPIVNLFDDPLHEKAYFQEKFDEECVPCQTKPIIYQGAFKGFIHNLKTAHFFKEKPTGNGFGGGISMVNCYLEPGKNSFQELIAPIQNGVYITDLIGLHAGIKTVSGDFSLQASGFKIEAGKITSPVKMIVLSGNFFQVLKDIVGIANDFEFQTSGFGSASVCVSSLSIAGKN